MASEIRALQEAGEAFKSGVFKLQIEETLNEVSFSEPTASAVRSLLFKIRDVLATCSPEKNPVASSDSEVEANGIKVRVPIEQHIIDQTWNFIPPTRENVHVVGSWTSKTSIRKKTGRTPIDMFVGMNSEMFEPKDFRDYRFHRKHAAFIARLATVLKSSALPLSVEYTSSVSLNGSFVLPSLLIVPDSSLLPKKGRKLCILLHAGPESLVFPLKKLALGRENVREGLLDQNQTNIYNWTVARSQLTLTFQSLMHSTSLRATAFADAVKLGSIWLQQRNFTLVKTGFGTFEFALLLAFLLKKPARLPAGCSSYQLFRGALLFLAEHINGSINLRLDVDVVEYTDASSEQGLENKRLRLCVDGVDMLANVHLFAFDLLQQEALSSTDMLNDLARDRFAALFLTPQSLSQARYDLNLEIKLSEPTESASLMHVLSILLRKAWGSRCICFSLTADNNESQNTWSLNDSSSDDVVKRIHVSAQLDAHASEKRLTFMSPEFSSTAEFKEFWGEKCSLRRFGNGEIKEAVVWYARGQSVSEESAVYAIHHNLAKLLQEDIRCKVHLNKLNSSNLGSLLPESSVGYGPFLQSFQALQNVLSELRDSLPLRIHSTMGVSSSFRYSSLSVPEPYNPSDIAEAVILLESTPKWPSDAEGSAIAATAFAIQIAEKLRDTAKYACMISMEQDGSVESGRVNVQTPEGYYFKFQILCDQAVNTPEGNKVLDVTDHTRMLASLAPKFPTYSGTCRLFKLWIDKQMLSAYFSEPLCELIVLHVYLNSAPYAPPATISSAFFRIFELLASWDFKEDFLFVDTNVPEVDSGDSNTTNGVHSTGCSTPAVLFESACAGIVHQRQQDPAFTQAPMLVATNKDLSGARWSSWDPRTRVAVVICARLVALARQALFIDSLDPLFAVDVSDFDVAFRVRFNAGKASKKVDKTLSVSDPEQAMQKPVALAQEMTAALRRLYQDSLILFNDGLRTQDDEFILCGIWNAFANAKLKPGVAFPVKPNGDKFEVDKDAIIAEIERLSGCLVRIK